MAAQNTLSSYCGHTLACYVSEVHTTQAEKQEPQLRCPLISGGDNLVPFFSPQTVNAQAKPRPEAKDAATKQETHTGAKVGAKAAHRAKKARAKKAKTARAKKAQKAKKARKAKELRKQEQRKQSKQEQRKQEPRKQRKQEQRKQRKQELRKQRKQEQGKHEQRKQAKQHLGQKSD